MKNTNLDVGSVMTTQGVVSMGNVAGDASVEVDLGTLTTGGPTVTIEFDVLVDDRGCQEIAPGVHQRSRAVADESPEFRASV